MRKRNFKRILNIIAILLVCGFGYCYWGFDLVPASKYETVEMQSGQNEAFYVQNWCTEDFGRREFMLWDRTRVDCLTKDYALEFDFAHKWAESVGQSLYYSIMTKRQPGVVLILTKFTDIIYLKRLEAIANKEGIKIFVVKAY